MSDCPVRPRREYDLDARLETALAPLRKLLDEAKTQNAEVCLGVDLDGYLILFDSQDARASVTGAGELGRSRKRLPLAAIGGPTLPSVRTR